MTVQGPVKEQQRDGMSHRGRGMGGGVPHPPPTHPPPLKTFGRLFFRTHQTCSLALLGWFRSNPGGHLRRWTDIQRSPVARAPFNSSAPLAAGGGWGVQFHCTAALFVIAAALPVTAPSQETWRQLDTRLSVGPPLIQPKGACGTTAEGFPVLTCACLCDQHTTRLCTGEGPPPKKIGPKNFPGLRPFNNFLRRLWRQLV